MLACVREHLAGAPAPQRSDLGRAGRPGNDGRSGSASTLHNVGLVTVAAFIAILGACMGLAVASFGIALSSAPGWRSYRDFHLLALACGIYGACESVATLDVSLGWRQACLGVSLVAVGGVVAAWLLIALRNFPSPLMRIFARVIAPFLLVASVLALWPGMLISDSVRKRSVAWIGITYHDVLPTPLGTAVLVFFGVALVALMLQILFLGRGTTAEAVTCRLLMVLTIAGFVFDNVVYLGWVDGPYVAVLALGGATLFIGALTVRRFRANAQALEDLTRQLERRVEQRTAELHRSNEALARAEKLAALGTLAAGVAHEINNPAASVISNLGYLTGHLERGELPKDAAQCLEESSSAMDRIQRIVRQLLDAGRAAGSKQALREAVDVSKAVASTLALARASLPPTAKVVVEVPPHLHVRGATQLLEQILTNLIVNAGQAIVAGKGQGTITVRGAEVEGQVLLEVQDDGCGMDEATRKRIFEPFFTTKPVGKGTGLGLAVTAGLVTSMGGTLNVKSAVDQGTTMSLRLPLAVAGDTPSGGTPALAA
jgi:signal transduction histidine kinase